ncbi:glycine-rich cell wall structural protein 1-like [Cucumis melo var. makuwa]|uniref:Glycine-rich cell wall structural protein 1-like n=1 Tax=Cucumis melo var. makuwa TaxID=1194695 RepID=A0A5D3CQE0_CUCMM|nr:glycine-rich cell wall structural protein 1-like [Cucumis melo var. makuwa]TYK13398.1 glycine-rich cell wall structural protein 1-like [Cucumis melo var. makuwa]
MATLSCAPKHECTNEEEGTLIDCLVELVSTSGWKSDNEMWWPACSGFRWNNDAKCIIAKKEVFENWFRFKVVLFFMQSHLAAKCLLNKPFSYYDELAYAFERDKSRGRFVETFANVGSNEPVGYEEFDVPDGNDMEFPSM